MQHIDEALFNFSPAAGIAVAFMVGFLVFGASLDLKWEQFRRILRAPLAPVVGLLGQFVILPAVAFIVGLTVVDAPSVALGLLLVACCPGGALSNYFTSVAKGDVATSISMTAASTLASILATPLVFGFWASLNPSTSALLADIGVEPKKVVMMLMLMLVIPVTAAMFIGAKRPELARGMRPWVRRGSMMVFGTVVVVVLGMNAQLLIGYAGEALAPVLSTFAIAALLGWALARLSGLRCGQRRAIALEVAMQNVGLALGMAMAFFPALAGVAVTGALWGVVHLACGFALAVAWARTPAPREASPAGH